MLATMSDWFSGALAITVSAVASAASHRPIGVEDLDMLGLCAGAWHNVLQCRVNRAAPASQEVGAVTVVYFALCAAAATAAITTSAYDLRWRVRWLRRSMCHWRCAVGRCGHRRWFRRANKGAGELAIARFPASGQRAHVQPRLCSGVAPCHFDTHINKASRAQKLRVFVAIQRACEAADPRFHVLAQRI